MKIIEDGRAPNPRRVRIFLAEKGISVPFEQVDINAGEHMSGPIAEANPWRRVPVLLLDTGEAISESVAICRYFEALQPEPALFGRMPVEQGFVEMWNRRVELGLLFHIAQAFRHMHPAMAKMEQPQVSAWGEACRSKILDDLAQLDRQLASSPFLAGDNFSIADITALVAFDFMRVTKMRCPDDHTNLWRWHGVVSARPSAEA